MSWLFTSGKVLELPWDYPDKNTGVGCHFLLQGIFLTPEPTSPTAPALAREFFTTEINTGKPLILILSRDPQTFLAKSWMVNILGFSGNVVSVELI